MNKARTEYFVPPFPRKFGNEISVGIAAFPCWGARQIYDMSDINKVLDRGGRDLG